VYRKKKEKGEEEEEEKKFGEVLSRIYICTHTMDIARPSTERRKEKK